MNTPARLCQVPQPSCVVREAFLVEVLPQGERYERFQGDCQKNKVGLVRGNSTAPRSRSEGAIVAEGCPRAGLTGRGTGRWGRLGVEAAGMRGWRVPGAGGPALWHPLSGFLEDPSLTGPLHCCVGAIMGTGCFPRTGSAAPQCLVVESAGAHSQF